MAAFICFLRGVNVGGKGKMPMAELKTLMENQGLENVRTVLQSGNAVFSAKGSKAVLAKAIETAIEKTFRYKSEVQLLTAAELESIVDGNPYPAEAKKDPGHLLVAFLPAPAAKDATAKLKTIVTGEEKFTVTPRAVYIHFAHGIGRSKLAGALDRAVGVRATSRNWNTVTKMLDLARAL